MYINVSKLARKNKLNITEATINESNRGLLSYDGVVICKKYKDFEGLIISRGGIYFCYQHSTKLKKEDFPVYIIPSDVILYTLKDDYVSVINPFDYCIVEKQFLKLGLDKVFPDYMNKKSCLIDDTSLLQVA